MNKEVLLRARQLIEAREFQKARALLQTIPNDLTAQKWLAKLDQVMPQSPKSATPQPIVRPAAKPSSTNNGFWLFIYGFVIIAIIGAIGGAVFVVSQDDNDDDVSDSIPVEDVASYMVTLNDLPRGWELDDESIDADFTDSFANGTNDPCQLPSPRAEDFASSSTNWFSNPLENRYLVESIDVTSSDAVAQAFLDEIRRVVTTCNDWFQTDDGEVLTTLIPNIAYGDSSVAFLYTIRDFADSDFLLKVYVVQVRRANKLITVFQFDFEGTVDFALWDLVINTTLERMAAP